MIGDDEQPVEDVDDGEAFDCWCGERITEADMAPITGGCGGLGTLYCDCGGDSLCVCHNHGEAECPGCADCDNGDDDDDDDGL